ncbi:MAG: aminotransferase class V-fold PLP-dependent enzyme [Acidobacteriota bacterium]|nr:aminotransferase class V-fold PLP-dependent enzyme [Acidobacteriota bacterium]MDW3228516.1 aminotransferase class V-fold PLP-dependent enzyme [Acidobacteriota bacterium]MDY0231592.1 aminotransferase class V-fold PLP-dependent enzyme [Candidatus Saccharicenans sp.]
MSEPDTILNLFTRTRRRFPALNGSSVGEKYLYLNSGAGSLMVDSALQAINSAASSLNPMPGEVTPVEKQTFQFHNQVRKMVAEFIGASSLEEISFHFSTTNALFNLAFSLGSVFKPGQNCLVTDLDHFANISPWETVAASLGAEIRTVRLNPDLTLNRLDLLDKLDANTVMVAVTAASNALGTILPLTDLISEIKEKSRALVVVDAVHLAPHSPIDVREIGCDFLAFSGYKIFGPMVGILFSRKEVLSQVTPYRVETNRNSPPYFWEQGMLPNINLAGLKGALDYLFELGQIVVKKDPSATPPKVFRRAMEAIKKYEQSLSLYFLERLKKLNSSRLRLYGINNSSKVVSRTPTFAIEISGLNPTELKKLFWETGRIVIADGNHYSAAVVRHLKKQALNRVSLAHYDSPESIDLFFESLEKIIFFNRHYS